MIQTVVQAILGSKNKRIKYVSVFERTEAGISAAQLYITRISHAPAKTLIRLVLPKQIASFTRCIPKFCLAYLRLGLRALLDNFPMLGGAGWARCLLLRKKEAGVA